jgi:perosamine synthetase
MSRMADIPIASPLLGPEEHEAVERVLTSGRLAQGAEVAELERLFALAAGTRFAIAVSSGTAALHTALVGVGVGPGDEVVTTPFTFIASANAALMAGASVRFVDIDPDTFCIDPAAVDEAVGDGTRAIVAVDLYGRACDGPALEDLARRRGVALVEDAAQSIGAELEGRPCGSFGDAACFSLYATKNIISGEGGVVTTDSEELNSFARRFRQHGMRGPYDYMGLGWNYRLTDLAASIGVVQMSRLADLSAARQQRAALLNETLADLPGITPPAIPSKGTSVWHQYTIRVTAEAPLSRDELATALRADGVGAAVYYPLPLHLVDHLRDRRTPEGSLPHAEQAAREVLSLPVHPAVSLDDVARVGDAVRRAVTRLHRG